MKKGSHHTAEARKKIGIASTERWKSPEMRAKVRAALLGIKRSEETFAKASAAHMGKKHTLETRAKMSEAKRGANHPNWRGGGGPYAWTFNKKLKGEVRQRDEYRCQLCGVSQTECEVVLDVHHIDYNKQNSDPVNLIVLCHSCHSRTNTNREHWTKLFQAMAIERDIAALKKGNK